LAGEELVKESYMTTKQEWWQSFFRGISAEVQRLALTEADAVEDADFIETVMKLEPGAKLLDVPCGLGRHALTLAAKGYQVTGVDITAAYIEEAKRLADKRGLSLELHELDMRKLPWQREFDAVYCMCGSFGYFDDQGNREFVAAAARALKPGGRLLIDGHVAESLLPKFQHRDWMQFEDILLLQDRSWDLAGGRIDATWVGIRGDEKETYTSSMRIYTFRELSAMLTEEGFTDLQAYGSHSLDPFRVGSRRLYLVARKSE
jgi:SAM-dependent methyltransferase